MAETSRSEEFGNNEDKKYPMRRVCAKCGKDMGIAGMSDREGEISHGYCDKCGNEELEKIRKMREEREKNK